MGYLFCAVSVGFIILIPIYLIVFFFSSSMTSSLHQSEQYLAAATVVRVLRSAGYEAYFVGGCVRDLLLGVVAKDFDVATSATPDVVMASFEKTFSVGGALWGGAGLLDGGGWGGGCN